MDFSFQAVLGLQGSGVESTWSPSVSPRLLTWFPALSDCSSDTVKVTRTVRPMQGLANPQPPAVGQTARGLFGGSCGLSLVE